MAGTQEQPANILPLPRWTLIIHGAQALFAVVILGLAAFGTHVWPYNALIFTIVCAILTFAACAYIVGTTLTLKNLYNGFVVLGLHVLLDIFWVVSMGLVANLARVWGDYKGSSYTYYWYYYKRDLSKRGAEDVTVQQYWSTLTACALFCAAELALWAGSTLIVLMYLFKNRKNSTANTTQQAPAHGGNVEAAPEKFGQTGVSQQPAPVYQQPQQPQQVPQQQSGMGYQQQQQPGMGYQQQQPQQQYVGGEYQQTNSGVSSPQSQYVQPYGQPSQVPYGQQPVYNQHSAPYPQDPVNRTETVSPVSQAAYSEAPTHNEPTSHQHGGAYNYSDVSELPENGMHPKTSELPGQR